MSDERQAQCKQCGELYDANDPAQVAAHETLEHGNLSFRNPVPARPFYQVEMKRIVDKMETVGREFLAQRGESETQKSRSAATALWLRHRSKL